MSHGVQELLRIGRNTADLDRALAFYHDALGFHVDAANAGLPAWAKLPGLDGAPTRCAHLSLGAQHIELTEFQDAAPYPAGYASCNLVFQHCAIVVDDMDAAHLRATQHGAVPITRDGPQTLPPSTGSVTAFKFRDPDGHPLELIAFPPGIGDSVWQSMHGAGLTLGIDHSAISVGDVARSIRFYQLLGLHGTARNVNRGIEQQRLDDLADVEVDVIAMQISSSATPHLELLGYRRPRGRANAATSVTATAADRLIWQATAIDVLLDALDAADFDNAVVASGFVDGATAALLRDPDGHLLVLGESTARNS
jgi:catechol 2,3-dioxygenase-like lactoylglutathione lyase family enzyme